MKKIIFTGPGIILQFLTDNYLHNLSKGHLSINSFLYD